MTTQRSDDWGSILDMGDDVDDAPDPDWDGVTSEDDPHFSVAEKSAEFSFVKVGNPYHDAQGHFTSRENAQSGASPAGPQTADGSTGPYPSPLLAPIDLPARPTIDQPDYPDVQTEVKDWHMQSSDERLRERTGRSTLGPGAIGIEPSLLPRVKKLAHEMQTRIDLTGADARVQAGAVQALERFHDTYPKLRVRVRTDNTLMDDSTIAQTEHLSPSNYTQAGADGPDPDEYSEIAFNMKKMADYDVLDADHNAAVLKGFLAHGAEDAADAIVTHELGHVLHDALEGASKGEVYDRAAEAAFGHPGLPTGEDIFGKVASLSQYATTSAPEFIAEAFNNLQSEHPRPIAQRAIDAIDFMYRHTPRFAT